MDFGYIKDKIEERLKFLLSESRMPEAIRDLVVYYPLQEGKRIRPLILAITTENLGGNLDDAITVGCAIEIIHNYSLIHDDLPCMDDDDFRRGKPTCHKVFGEANAVLAGDALLTYAFQILSERELYKNLDDKQLIDLINIISKKAGIWGMVLGQFYDINDNQDIYEINRHKTAAMFEACFMCAGIIANRYEMVSELERLGRAFGLLFQYTDDILDKDGIYVKGLDYAKEEVRKFKEEAISILDRIMERDRGIRKIVDLVADRIENT